MKRPVSLWPPLALLILSVAASAAPGDTIYAHPGRLVSAGDGTRLNFNMRPAFLLSRAARTRVFA